VEQLLVVVPASLVFVVVLILSRHLRWRWQTRGVARRRSLLPSWLRRSRRDEQMERRIQRIGELPAAEDDIQDRAA